MKHDGDGRTAKVKNTPLMILALMVLSLVSVMAAVRGIHLPASIFSPLSLVSVMAAEPGEVGVIIGGIVLFAIFWLIVVVLLCVWVYRDAKARGENAALWLIIVLIAGIIGSIIWLVVRPKKKVAEAGE